METFSIVISVIALSISLLVAWKNYISPFEIRIHSGNPRLETAPVMLPGGGQVMRFAVVLPLHIINKGAQDGLIRDIVLMIHTNADDWFYYPAFYCDYNVSTNPTLGDTLTKKESNIPFYPIHVDGRASLYKSIIFVFDAKNEKFPIGTTNMTPGDYHFTVNILESGHIEYRERLSFIVPLSDEQIRTLNESTKHNILIPYTKEVLERRKLLHPIKPS